MGDVILTMKDIDKSFPGVHALDHVNFEVRRGEVHALMGENGAGKSTLMKVLTGIYQKDSGSICTNGTVRWSWSVRVSLQPRIRLQPSTRCSRHSTAHVPISQSNSDGQGFAHDCLQGSR